LARSNAWRGLLSPAAFHNNPLLCISACTLAPLAYPRTLRQSQALTISSSLHAVCP
jgi:hypothetical protein